MKEPTILQCQAEAQGWHVIETGGGCTALQKSTGIWTGLITDDAQVPTNNRDGCILGIYTSEDGNAGELIISIDCPTVLQAFELFTWIIQ